MAKRQQRDSKREAFGRGVLARQPQSGLSGRRFCVRERVSEPSFYAWRRVVRERDAERAQGQPAFVPVGMRDGQGRDGDAGIVVELRGGGPGARAWGLRLPTTMPVEQVADLVHAREAAPAPGGSVAEDRT